MLVGLMGHWYWSFLAGKGEPGGLPSMGSHSVGHDWSDLAAAAWIQRLGGEEDTEPGTWNAH